MKLRRRDSGQTLVETLIASAMAVLAISALVLLLYRGLVYFAARQSLNELLFCLASVTAETTCRAQFQSRVEKLLIFKETSNLHIKKFDSYIETHFKVDAKGAPTMKLKRRLSLPLRSTL